MTAIYDSNLYNSTHYSPEGIYEYKMMTPFRAIGSIGFFIGKHGFISGEYEYVNFSQARFKASDDDFSDINSDIKSSYNSPVNFRIGTEWSVSIFRIRAGFGYNGSPDYKGDIGTRYTASGGFGVRLKHFFADIAYQWAQIKSNYYLYDPDLVNPAEITARSHSIATTIGFRF
jgi:hypothetical protein